MKAYVKRKNWTIPTTPKSLNRRHTNLHRWLRPGYLSPCKILSTSDNTFHFRTCTNSCTNSCTKLFTWLLFGHSL